MFVSIIIVSGWFTPGIPLVAGYETLSPSLEGINFGLLRVLILVEIVIAVNILMMTTSTPDLVSALQWLLTPLSIFGINSNKIAARIVTTIDEIKSPTIDLKKLIQETRKETPLNRMTHVITRAYIMSINGMKHDNDVEILLQQQKAPSIFQWLWLPLIILFYYVPVIIY